MKLPDELRSLGRTTEETLPRLSPCVWPFVIVGGVLALGIAIPVVACLGVGAACILGVVGGVAFVVYVLRIVVNRAVEYFMRSGIVPEGDDLEAAEGKGDDKVVVTQEDGWEPEQKHNGKVANTPPQAQELGQNEDSTVGVTRPGINELRQKEGGNVGRAQLDVNELGQNDDNSLEDTKRDVRELGQEDDVKVGSSRLHAEGPEAPSPAYVGGLNKGKSNPPTALRELPGLLPI